jgi:hypothetical protein
MSAGIEELFTVAIINSDEFVDIIGISLSTLAWLGTIGGEFGILEIYLSCNTFDSI